MEPNPPRAAMLGVTLLRGPELELGCSEVRLPVVDWEDLKIGRDQWVPLPDPKVHREDGQGATAPGAAVPGGVAGEH